MTYIFVKNNNGDVVGIFQQSIGCIPVDPANTDYQKFKSDLASGAELQDANGTVMTADQIQTFLQGLK